MSLRWRPTAWLVANCGAAAALVVLGLLLRRADLVVFALGPLGITGWSLLTRPTGVPRLEGPDGPATMDLGQHSTRTVAGHDLSGVEQWYVRWPRGGGLRWRHRTVGGFVDTESAQVGTSWTADRIGAIRIDGPATVLLSRWAGYRAGPVLLRSSELTVRPRSEPAYGRAEVPHPVGLVGAHRSRRRGAGSEFAEVRGYRPGDRLRSIDWARSARTGGLFVRDQFAEQDAAVLVVLDGAGGDDTWQRGLQCAATAAAFFLRHGDRVGLIALGDGAPRTVPYRSGLRHYQRIADVLSTVARPTGEQRVRRLRLPVAAGGLVLLVSPMLTDLPASTALGLARHGVDVIVLDTARIPPGAPEVDRLAMRLRLLERRVLLERLARSGVQLTAWDGPISLQLPLQRIARRPPTRVGAR